MGVDRANWYEPGLNRTYLDMATHYGTAILPTRVGKPRDKAKVEVAVLVVERWILARRRHRRFFSLAELNEAIAGLERGLNAASPCIPGLELAAAADTARRLRRRRSKSGGSALPRSPDDGARDWCTVLPGCCYNRCRFGARPCATPSGSVLI